MVRFFGSLLAIACLSAALPAMACPEGARCLSVPQPAKPAFERGDILAPGSFNILLNAAYFGLPRPDPGTVYVAIDRRALKVRLGSYEVLEDVTHLTNRAFW